MMKGASSLYAVRVSKELRRRARNVYLAARGQRLRPSSPTDGKPEPAEAKQQEASLDINVLLHAARSARLRQIPSGAKVMCSAGCAGTWYFDWVEKCYGPVDRHIGVEYYTPKPVQLPSNVDWVENTVSDMSAVGGESCDLVFSGQNLEHLWPDEVVGFLLESWRILSSGGVLVIDSPNRSITERLSWSHPEHTVELTLAEAKELVSLAGFDVTRSFGIWLCQDPDTASILPFEPAEEGSGWTVPERLVLASSFPSDSFIWWLEAEKTARQPDEQALQLRMSEIFEAAWAERIQRLKWSVGIEERRADGTWIVCEKGVGGHMLWGPFMPLKGGSYRVTFQIKAVQSQSEDQDQPIAICDVTKEPGAEPIVVQEIRASDLTGGSVTLDFTLPKLAFGIQFRCQSLGVARVECLQAIVLDRLDE